MLCISISKLCSNQYRVRASTGDSFSAEDAQTEADELRAARLAAMVTALDKAKLFLRRQPREARVRFNVRNRDVMGLQQN